MVRTALLSTLERTQDSASRAFSTLGGRPVIEWQLDLVRDLGCEQIICLAENPSPQLEKFRDRVNAFDLEFRAIGGPLQLVGLLSVDHELFVIGDGVIFDRVLLKELFGGRRGIAVVPADPGVAAGFERIDASHAWGGLMVARGRIAEGLAQMPPDSDTISLLLRLALQAGTPLIAMDGQWLEDGTLLLATSNLALETREKALLDRSTQALSWIGPFDALAQVVARRLAPAGLARGPGLAAAASAVFAVAGAALAFVEQGVWGLAALALAGFCGALAISLSALKSRLLGAAPALKLSRLFRVLLDFSAIMVLTLPWSVSLPIQRVALALLLIGLWRVAEHVGPARFAPFWHDRALFAAILAAAGFSGIAPHAILVLALAALAYSLFFTYRQRLTQV